MTGSNFTDYAGTNRIIDGSNTIRCDISPLTVSLDGTFYVPTAIHLTGFTTSGNGATLSLTI